MTAPQLPTAESGPGGREPVKPVPLLGTPGTVAGWVWLLRPLGLYAASRLLVLVAVGTGALVAPDDEGPLSAGPWPPGGSTGLGVVDGLLRWDSAWYLHIAEAGYSESSADGRNAFFPLLPLLVRLVAGLPGVGGLVEAGLIVALLAGAVATILVWALGRELADEPTADRMAALFAFFPGSAVLSMVYAEGLLVALAAAVLLALQRRQWLLAGVLAAVATSSRPTGVAVGAACAWAALAAVVLAERREWRALVAPALAPAGLVAFFGYLAARTGDPAAWFSAQRAVWGERVDVGGQVERVAVVFGDPLSPLGGGNTWLPVIGLAVIAVALVALLAWPGGHPGPWSPTRSPRAPSCSCRRRSGPGPGWC